MTAHRAHHLLPSPQTLREFLIYDPETGKLFWREREPSMFRDGKQSAEHVCARWNKSWAGKEAFTAENKGYRVGAIWAVNYQAHRVIWAIAYGEWPEDQIDHDNRKRSDNRLKNLVEATNQQNQKNRSMSQRNTSGVTGVYWHKYAGKWMVMIATHEKRSTYLGLFSDFNDAVAVRRSAEIEYGYHINHGRLV